MPLAKEPEIIPKAPEPEYTPIIPREGIRSSGEYKNSVVDVRERSVTELMAHVEGSKWTVVYYRQLLTKDMEGASFQYRIDSPTQQYEKINDYPLRVTDPLSSSQNEETLLFEVSGSGILPYALIPNVGDVFIGDIGDGRYALFSIEKITRKTILKNSVYELEYVLLDYLTIEIERILEKCTVRELFHSNDFIGAQVGPLISEKELSNYNDISEFVNKTSEYYINTFKDNNTQAILFPDNDYKIYDPYMAVFWDYIMPKDNFDYKDIPRLLTTYEIPEKSILDCILNQNNDFRSIYTYSDFKQSNEYFDLLIYNGVFFTEIDKVIHLCNDETIQPLMKEKEYYIFSESFYYKDEFTMDTLELLTMAYLNSISLNLDIFIPLIKSIDVKTLQQQFYEMPILIAMAIEYMRNH